MNGLLITLRRLLVRLTFGLARRLPLRHRVVLATAHADRIGGNLASIRDELGRRDPPVPFVELAHRPAAGWRGRVAASWQAVLAGYHLATASVFVVDDYFFPIYVIKPRRGTTIVQTWHGCGAFKKFGYSVLDKTFGADEDLIGRVPIHSNYDVCLVSSMSVAPHYAEAFRQPLERFRADLGIPRTDVLFGDERIARTVAALRRRYAIPDDRRVILYAPTFRGERVTEARFSDDLDLGLLRDRLGDDHVVLVRRHPFVRRSAPLGPELAGFAIDVSDHPDVNELLLVSDLLVTDYSSVIYEFSLLARPMLFFAPDFEAYERERGFYFDYRTGVPGPIFETSAPLADAIRAGAFDRARVEAFRRRRSRSPTAIRPSGSSIGSSSRPSDEGAVRYAPRAPPALAGHATHVTGSIDHMTFRAKPVVKRSHRPSWENQDRRNFYLNIGFGLVVLAAVLILLIAAGLTWYNEHLASVGSVDGQSISKDEFNDRLAVEKWRLDEAEGRIRSATVAGHLTDAQAQVQQSIIDQQRNQIEAIALERLIDTKLQAKLAAADGITATPEDIDARLVTEATQPESRHAWVIEVQPATDLGALEPTAAQKAQAKATADAALKDLQGGKAWDEVAKTVSTDASSAPQAGDLGWIQRDDSQADEPYLDAIFAAAVDSPTAVVEGADGIYRIGRVTEIAPQTVDAAYTEKIVNAGVDLARYRTVAAGDVIHQKLEDQVVADATKPGPQRETSEIFIQKPAADLPADSIKVRHILYSPKDDPSAASNGDIADNDPSWAAAEAEARAAYAKIKADPNLFDSIARAESDEPQDRGVTGTGGKLPYVDSTSGYDEAFSAAILKPGLVAGQLLEPVKSAFGWHVIQVMYRPTDDARIKELKTKADAGGDFAALARDNSEGSTAGRGGDLGWLAKGQIDDRLSAAIFATPVGKTSDVVTLDIGDTSTDGVYLFKVLAEETRTPVGRQLDQIKSSAFSSWYTLKKDAVKIERDPTISGAAG